MGLCEVENVGVINEIIQNGKSMKGIKQCIMTAKMLEELM